MTPHNLLVGWQCMGVIKSDTGRCQQGTHQTNAAHWVAS